LAARPADVVSFQPRRGAPLHGAHGRGLDEGLARWRRTILRRRLIVVIRRALLVALAALVALLIVRALGVSLAGWLLVAVPLVVFAAACALALAGGGLALGRVARLLDRALALSERLGTAWELGAPADGTLARQVVDDGDRLVWDVGDRFEARTRPARREWTGLLIALGASAVLLAVGAGGRGDGAGSLRAGTGDGASARQQSGARRSSQSGTTTAPAATPNGTTTPLSSAPPGTTTIPHTGAPSAGGSPTAAGTRIAIRQQPANGPRNTPAGGAQGARHGGANGGGAGADAAKHSNGAASATGRRGTPANVAPLPGRTPPSSHVKGFSLQGQRATAPVSAGEPTEGSRGAGAPRSGARSGTQGAGQQQAPLGNTGGPRDASTGTRRLPLRTLATSGGQERGAGAGRAGTGGRGHGTARVQSGPSGGATGSGAGGTAPSPLAFVPTDVNVITPYLRSLVSAYFPQR
jgi:hypothetical protein